MVRGLIILALLLVAACGRFSGGERGHVVAHIAEDVVLTLPTPPRYPETKTVVQVVQARYGEQSATFEAVVSLSPSEVSIIITVLGGPRVATLTWDAHGVDQQRTLLAPAGVPVENILADIFLVLWPDEAIARSLPEGVEMGVMESGGRFIRRGDETIVEILPDPSNPSRTTVRNLAFGYEVTVATRSIQ